MTAQLKYECRKLAAVHLRITECALCIRNLKNEAPELAAAGEVVPGLIETMKEMLAMHHRERGPILERIRLLDPVVDIPPPRALRSP